MCSNCKGSDGCSCTGGSAFASCLCEQGERCSACGHDAQQNAATQADPLMISDPDLAVEIVEYE